jgi:hypothetical protein
VWVRGGEADRDGRWRWRGGYGGGVRIQCPAIPPKEGKAADGQVSTRCCHQSAGREGRETVVEVMETPVPPGRGGRRRAKGEEGGAAGVRRGASKEVRAPEGIGLGERNGNVGRKGGRRGSARTRPLERRWGRWEGERRAQHRAPVTKTMGPRRVSTEMGGGGSQERTVEKRIRGVREKSRIKPERV